MEEDVARDAQPRCCGEMGSVWSHWLSQVGTTGSRLDLSVSPEASFGLQLGSCRVAGFGHVC